MARPLDDLYVIKPNGIEVAIQPLDNTALEGVTIRVSNCDNAKEATRMAAAFIHKLIELYGNKEQTPARKG